MQIKVKQGTRPSIDLCRSCSFVTLIEGPAGTQQIKRCGPLQGQVTFPVVACNQWQDRNATGLWDMQQIAWVIEMRGSRPIGFLSPAERRKNGDPDIC